MLRIHEIPSLYLGVPRRITVWLPPGSRRRVAAGLPLNTPDPSTFFSGGAAGYVDYPRACVRA